MFPESALAHHLLDGMLGIEIGGAAHNAFGLDTWNIDCSAPGDPGRKIYDGAQMGLCGAILPVDVVAFGDRLPFRDDAFDFVISSHVIEHFYDPIAALREWARVARRYVYIICPQRDALPSDVGLPLTSLGEHERRHSEAAIELPFDDAHHSRWTSESFCALCAAIGYRVVAVEDPDQKVGNGFTVVLDVGQEPVSAGTLGRASRWLRSQLKLPRTRSAHEPSPTR